MLHINSIDWAPNGDEYHVYAGCHCLFNYTQKSVVVSATPEEIAAIDYKDPFFEYATPNQPHDIRIYDDDIGFMNSSGTNETLKVYLNEGTFEVIHKEDKVRDYDTRWSKSGWARGMAIQGNKLFVTYTPCILRVFDIDTCSEIDTMIFSTDCHETPFDILFDPRDMKEEL